MISGVVPANTAKPSPITNLLSNLDQCQATSRSILQPDCHDRAQRLDADRRRDHHGDGHVLCRPAALPAARRRWAAALHGARGGHDRRPARDDRHRARRRGDHRGGRRAGGSGGVAARRRRGHALEPDGRGSRSRRRGDHVDGRWSEIGDAMDRYGYWNKILHVNLSDRSTWIEEPGDLFFRRYAGGRGLIAHYLLKYVPKGADPLGPDNILVIAPGVLTGAPVPGAGRHSVGAKSPLTGGFGESESGGYWGAELKRAGWDAIVFHGASPTPVYLWINDGVVEIRDAAHLWGRITGEVEDAILAELGDLRIRVAQIGPAGENLVRFACIANELNEVAGRTGMGAVMGSKRLKAIAVRGKIPVKIADQPGLMVIAKWVSGTMDEKHRAFHEFGTGAAMQGKSLEGGMPVLNYRLGAADTVAKVDAIAVRDDVRVKMGACYACSVRCKKVVHIEKKEEAARVAMETIYKGRARVAVDPLGRYRVDPRYGGPEYESLASLGVNLGLDDLIAICKSNEMCNYLAMDTVSLGSTLAWAMECFEKGILTLDDADGVVKLVEMIAYRQGVGDLLAEGSQRAAQRLGRGSEAFLTTVKGMEMAMHDPRHMPVMRASYMMAPTGGDHMRQSGNRNGLRNQIAMCHFLAYEDDQTLAILNAVTGWGATQEEVVATAHRGLTLARLFNLREGFTRADD